LNSQVECPCGAVIENPLRYTLLFLKKELHEIDILCPNEMCYLRELGYVRFDLSGQEAKFKEGSFYPPFVTWNATQLGRDATQEILRKHLKEIVTKHIKWGEIAQATKKASASEHSAGATESTPDIGSSARPGE